MLVTPRNDNEGGQNKMNYTNLEIKDKTNEELFKIAHAGNKEARDYLITSNMKLVYKIANETRNILKEVDFESLVQEGSIGLVKAVDIDSAVVIEAEDFGKCFATEDQTEGMSAFVERREKNFKNK